LTDGEFVGFLTIEYRERETWAAELVRNLQGFFQKETLAVTFSRDYTYFLDSGFRIGVD
jgi:hypothetical protein